MTERNLETEKGVNRDPSLSCWCERDGIRHLHHCSGNANAGVEEDQDYELSIPKGDGLEIGNSDREGPQLSEFRQRSMHLNGVHITENESVNIEGNENGKYVSFDIENEPSRDQHLLDFEMDDSRSNLQIGHATQSPIPTIAIIRTFFYILVWYTSSTCLTLYNKSLLGDNLGKFPAPMLMNTVHFVMQAVLSKVIIRFWSQNVQPTVTMSWRDYFLRVVPTAVGTALDINLSNASLVFISVTFATMCKSASPIFLLLFAFAFKLESPSIKLFGIIFIISIGILLTVVKETEFEFWGFIFVMLAAVLSGFRWSMTQILLQKEAYGLKHPLTFMSCVTPVMAVATALFSLMMDPWRDFNRSIYFDNSWHIIRSCLLMVIGGSLAFLMVLTEYILVSTTSAVTVTIAGVLKEAVTIVVAVFYFHDPFTLLKGIGLIIILVGVSLFNWYKYQKYQKDGPNDNEGTGSPISNEGAKYVILENMDGEDDNTGQT